MSSKRVAIAKRMANEQATTKFNQNTWLAIIYELEREGYQVVKTSETAEYQHLHKGLRNAQEG